MKNYDMDMSKYPHFEKTMNRMEEEYNNRIMTMTKTERLKEKRAYGRADKMNACCICSKKVGKNKVINMDEDNGFTPYVYCSIKCFDKWEGD